MEIDILPELEKIEPTVAFVSKLARFGKVTKLLIVWENEITFRIVDNETSKLFYYRKE